jgi:small subunit ribosomal protein S1
MMVLFHPDKLMSENFAQLFEESIKNLEMRPGEIVKGEVVRIDDKFVLVDAGLKSEAFIPVEQFKKEDGTLTVAVGDMVDVALEAVEDSYGETRLSRERARRIEVWQRLEQACENQENVIGVITGKVKGGFTVDLDGIKAFLPGSLVDVRPLRDTTFLEGKDLDFRVIKIDAKRNNVVVSRRAVIEAENSAERDALLESLGEGSVVKGIVKNLTDYGAFIDLGGIDGLLHITDMSWKRIRHPSEMIAVGDEIDVKVLKFDKDKGRVSLGLKQLGDDPWDNLIGKFPEGKRVRGEVTNVADYGCFVQLDDGIEGLVHVSEMDWTNKNINPHKIVSLGQEVEVIVLEVDEERRRISLGLKQCTDNPWQTFAATHQKGSKVKGVIKSITDFGVFIGLDGNIDGLIHLSDLSWDQPGEEAVHSFNKGDTVEAVVLTVDVERERISLGIKQLQDNPFGNYQEIHKKGDVVKGTVTEVDERIVTLDLGGGVVGQIRVNDLSPDRIEDARQHVSVGDELEAKILAFDRKNQLVTLSVKAVEVDLDNQTKQKYLNNSGDDAGKTTLGDILKEQLGGDQNK